MPKELTSATVKKYGLDAGATVVGIAAAEDFTAAPEGFKPADALPGCRSVIVLGTTFPAEVLGDADIYTESRNAMLSAMTDMAKVVAKRVKTDGYQTKAVSSSGGKWVQGDGRKELCGTISLKHAAALAGLGVIGKNYLLTNPQYGNMLWLSAVLTTAELVPDGRADFPLCNNCNQCVEVCPVHALDNTATFGRRDCSKFFAIENKKLRIKCYQCRTICPAAFGVEA
jgi:epoxyqueuosine reductase QueG